jgi:hypothetical protein
MVSDLLFPGVFDPAGRLRLDNRPSFDHAGAALAGKRVVLTVTPEGRKRSLRQNAYWWSVCVHLVSEHTGYEPEEVHDLAKKMFLPKRVTVRGKNGRLRGRFTIGGSTTKLKTGEMAEFVERFRRWAATELGVVIPDPNGEIPA